MRLVFAGTPEVAVPSLEALAASHHELAAVITRPDAPSGRGRRLVPSPVSLAAEELGLRVLKPHKAGGADFLDTLGALAPDACPVVAYGALLPRRTIEIPAHGWINLHFSLLPLWRGAAPVQHSLIAGDEVTGASTFRIEESLDSGPVFGSLTESIRATDTAGSLLGRLAQAGAGLLLATLDAIEAGQAQPVPQRADQATFAPKLGVDDAQVRWDHPDFSIDRRIRGCTPEPGAWTTFRGERLGLRPIALQAAASRPLGPGELEITKHSVLVGTATGPITLGEVQPAGRRAMPGADWARGARIESGEHLR